MPRQGPRHAVGTLHDYGRLFHLTLALLREHRPGVLWMQMPPLPLLWAGLWHRRRVDTDVRLVADCHNATFGTRWGRVPLALHLLAGCDLVVVHNDHMLREALARGLPRERLFVLEDVPPSPVLPTAAPLPTGLMQRPRPWVLVPGSFAADEPVGELMRAAALVPECTFVLTGRPENARRFGHRLDPTPRNVVLTGYLETAVFDNLLQASDLVLALTRQDGIQLSACNEALGFGKAMVVSDTPLLRRLFGDGVQMADSRDPLALARAIRQSLARRPELERAAQALAASRREQWKHRLEGAPEWLRT